MGRSVRRGEEFSPGSGRIRTYSSPMHIRVGVIGGGSWGTTVAHLAAHNAPTTLWARQHETCDEINRSHTNSRYLEGFELHPELRADGDLAAVVGESDVVVMGVPSHSYRSILGLVAEHIRAWVPVVSLTKGLEQGTRLAHEPGGQRGAARPSLRGAHRPEPGEGGARR